MWQEIEDQITQENLRKLATGNKTQKRKNFEYTGGKIMISSTSVSTKIFYLRKYIKDIMSRFNLAMKGYSKSMKTMNEELIHKDKSPARRITIMLIKPRSPNLIDAFSKEAFINILKESRKERRLR